MSFVEKVCLASVLASAVGCSAIYRADDAQREEATKGVGLAADIPSKFQLADYSLEELVSFAMTNRPSVVSAALAVEDARLALREIAADAPLVSYSPWTSPHLGLSGGYNASSAAEKHLHWRTEGNASAGLSLSILLYDFGRNEARAAAQVENLIASEYEFVKEGYAVFEEVAEAYFGLMECDALLQVANTNEVEYALHLKQAEDRLAAGEAQRLDVARAKVELSQAKEDVITASNSVLTAGAQLMRALGIDAAHGTRDEVYPPTGEALSTVMRAFVTTRYDVATAFQLARTNSPAMAIARARLRSASHAVDRAVADLMPSVSAEVSLSWADPLWVWHWGVNAAQSVFEGFSKVTAVDRAIVAMRSASVNVDETEQELSLALEKAIAVRDNAGKKWETAKVSLASAREELDLAKARYLEGDASRVDVTDAVSHHTTALGSRVTAFYAAQIAEAKLFAFTGQLPEYREERVDEK